MSTNPVPVVADSRGSCVGSSTRYALLLVEDSPDDAEFLARSLTRAKKARFTVTRVASLARAVELLAGTSFDAVLVDLTLPDSQGLETVERALSAAGSAPLIVITGQDDEQLAIAAVQSGAQDYLVKDEVSDAALARTVRHAIERKRVLEDMSDAFERQHYLATHDALTGLPNRMLFLDRLLRAQAMARRNRSGVAVLFVDLDGFKRINDVLGHDVGDRVLTQSAARLVSCVRETDTVARFGGDEFVVLLEDVEAHRGAERVAAAIVSVMNSPIYVSQQELSVTPSIGVAVDPSGRHDANTLVRCADAAMYRVKAKGGNGVEFLAELVPGARRNARANARIGSLAGPPPVPPAPRGEPRTGR